MEWRDDLRRVLKQAGAQFQPTAFLFSDTQLKDESFLEVSRRGGTMRNNVRQQVRAGGSHQYNMCTPIFGEHVNSCSCSFLPVPP